MFVRFLILTNPQQPPTWLLDGLFQLFTIYSFVVKHLLTAPGSGTPINLCLCYRPFLLKNVLEWVLYTKKQTCYSLSGATLTSKIPIWFKVLHKQWNIWRKWFTFMVLPFINFVYLEKGHRCSGSLLCKLYSSNFEFLLTVRSVGDSSSINLDWLAWY